MRVTLQASESALSRVAWRRQGKCRSVSNLAERVGDFGAKTVALHPTPARQQAVGIWSDISPPTRLRQLLIP